MRRNTWILMAMVAILLLSVQAVSAQDVTITWWHINTNEPEAAFYQTLADEFMAANPGVNIEITILGNADFKPRLTTVMQAGDPPDLFQSWGGGVLWQFADAGLVRDISPELTADDSAWANSFSAQAALGLYSQDEAFYGVPVTWGAVGMFYNKALFEQAGLDPENPPATWDEFIAAVEALKAAGITPISLGELEKWPGHFWWVYLAIRLGGEEAFLNAYNRTGAFTDEPFVQAGTYLEELVALEPFPEGFLGLGYGDQFTYFANGNAGMELMGQWAPGTYNSVIEGGLGENLGWFPFPAIEGGAGDPADVLGGGDGFAVGANAEDEAVAFLQYITSVENQSRAAEIWIVPTVAGAEAVVTDDPVMAAIVDARNNAPYFQLYYDQFLPPALGSEVNDAVETIFAGVGTAEDAAARIEDIASFELETE